MTHTKSPVRVIGRYALYDQIGAGGMATVHFGRLLGPAGFAKTVAIKRLHPHFARDPEFASMFLDEARLAARIHHPNVVATIDVVAKEGELFLVMEFVEGLSLSGLFWEAVRGGSRLPLGIIGAIMTNVLAGLHAAHEAKNERGESLRLIHRDVSPQNVIVGKDGVARVLDFGIAKAIGRSHTTREGRIKGKIAYMAPEQIRAQTLDRRVDVYAASVMLWELVTMRRLYDEEDDAATIYKAVNDVPDKPSTLVPSLSADVDEIIMRGLSKDREVRFSTAREMAIEVSRVFGTDSAMAVGDFVGRSGQETLMLLASKVQEIELASGEVDVLAELASNVPAPASRPEPASSETTLPVLPDLGSATGAAPARTAGHDTLLAPPKRSAATELMATPELPPESTSPSAAPPRVQLPPLDLGTSAGAFGTARPRSEPVKPVTREAAADDADAPKPSAALELDLPRRGQNSGFAMDPRSARALPRGFAAPAAGPAYAPLQRARPSLALPIVAAASILAIGALGIGGYVLVGRAAPSASAAAGPAPPGGLERACESGRKHILMGGPDIGAFDAYGWVVELWLAREDKPALDASRPGIAELRGPDGSLPEAFGLGLAAGDHGEVTFGDLPSPPPHPGTEPGIVVRFSGGYVSKFFSDNTRGAFVTVAESAYTKSGATIGALYAKCAHLPYHDVGAWFKGVDLATAADSLGFTVAGYTEAPWVSRGTFDPHGHAKNGFEAYQQHRLGIDKDAFKTQLEILGASVDDSKQGTTIIFTAANPTRATSAARWLTERVGL